MISDQNSIDDIIKGAKKDAKELQAAVESKTSKAGLSPNKIIDRLDDVTIQSEAEATKIIDMIDEIMVKLGGINDVASDLKAMITDNKGSTEEKLKSIENIQSIANEAQDMLFNVMNLLQYQDVLRQKIEKIASALTGFYDYLGEFLGKGMKKEGERTVGKHVEDSTLTRDQKLEEINKIIKEIKKD